MVFRGVIAAVALLFLSVSEQKALGGESNGSCKNATVVSRLMADDVRYASPFYVIALPKNPKTEQMDNVCYTYFENDNAFFHIMSVVYKNGSNAHYTFTKGDIANRAGLAEATAEKTSSCVYHDYTLTPICNVTVFVLYRCFIEGNCNDIDIGITTGVDVRVVLAATTEISDICRLETEANLKDTSSLAGGDYIILPQNRKPQCVTNFNNKLCINAQKALGSITVIDDNLLDRFGERNDLEFTGMTLTAPTEDNLETTQSKTELPIENKQGSPYLPTHPPTLPTRTYADVVKSPVPPATPKVFYHVHSWEKPQCRCNHNNKN